MADATALLREFAAASKPVRLDAKADALVFGAARVPRSTKTAYKSRKGKGDFYTVGTLWFLLENLSVSYTEYLKQCQRQKIASVSFIDRQDVIDYFTGKKDTSAYIDASAAAASPATKEHAAPVEALPSAVPPATTSGKVTSTVTEKETSGVGAEERVSAPDAVGPAAKKRRAAGDAEAGDGGRERNDELTSALMAKERAFLTRTSCQQSTKVRFSDVLGMMKNAERAIQQERDEDLKRKSDAMREKSRHDRFAQENTVLPPTLTQNERDDMLQLGIDTTGSFLQQSSVVAELQRAHERDTKRMQQSKSEPKRSATVARESISALKGKAKPIILVPSTCRPSDLITIANVKVLLDEGKFVAPDPRQRVRGRGVRLTVSYDLDDGGKATFEITTPESLRDNEWPRVVAIFAQGPLWQFKKWPEDFRDPVAIFSRARGFHLHYEDAKVDENIRKWDIKRLSVARHTRHLDTTTKNHFWRELVSFLRRARKDVEL